LSLAQSFKDEFSRCFPGVITTQWQQLQDTFTQFPIVVNPEGDYPSKCIDRVFTGPKIACDRNLGAV
jgi:hypothetical protein